MTYKVGGGSPHLDLTHAKPSASGRGTDPSTRILPRKGLSVSTHDALGTPANTFEQFKERKRCFDIKGDSGSLLQEIADLKVGITTVTPESRGEYENWIRFKEMQLADLKKCSENRAVTQEDLGKMLERAALQGDRAAQLAYAEDPMIDPSRAIDNLERLRAWHDRSLSYVYSAIEKGDGEAMVILAGAYDPFRCEASNEAFCSGMLRQLIDPEAQKAYRYYYESELTGKAPQWVTLELSAIERLLTQDQVASAKAEAEESLSNVATHRGNP